jgi:hypothetical protein
MIRHLGKAILPIAAIFSASAAQQASAAAPQLPTAPAVTYADLADLADSAPLVLRAQLSRLARVEPERAPGVRLGWGRFYAEAETGALLSGDALVGETLRYLVDLPLDSRGRPPRLIRKPVFLFAAPVAGKPGELRLVAPDAQVPWDTASEASLRAILTELVSPGAPARVTGVREAMHVPGELAGEGETQIFLATRDGSAASIAITRHAGAEPSWGVSFSEVLDTSSRPARETLRWYRLACFLPAALPPGSNLSEGAAAQAQAQTDYRLVIDALGPCPRNRS